MRGLRDIAFRGKAWVELLAAKQCGGVLDVKVPNAGRGHATGEEEPAGRRPEDATDGPTDGAGEQIDGRPRFFEEHA